MQEHFFSSLHFAQLLLSDLPVLCFSRPSRRRRSVGVANATEVPYFLTTVPSLPFGSTTASPEDEDNKGSKVLNAYILFVTQINIYFIFV